MPGSFEMQALANAALDAYLGRRRVRSYELGTDIGK
jgi:hypothetical protein